MKIVYECLKVLYPQGLSEYYAV